jgi:hypothetical protein
MKELKVGKDYASIFGLDPDDKGQHLIYKGGNKWLAQQPGSEREIESEQTTRNALAYINQPRISMGTL